jgi:hypothetical protein
MNREPNFTPRRFVPPTRGFVSIDLHKHFVVVAAVDAAQQVLLKPRRIALDDFPAWAKAHLGSEDAALLEATGNAWYFYDLLAPLVGRCVVANPLQSQSCLHLGHRHRWAERRGTAGSLPCLHL